MRVLLSDGCGVASRQTARLLHDAGHEVGVLSPDPLCLCRFTRTVRRVHVVPAAAADPYDWLDAAIGVHQAGRYDVLLPTQEQVAVLSRGAGWVAEAGVPTVVPEFEAMAAVYDKVSARATLGRLGVPQPASWVAAEDALAAWDRFPVFAKLPVATASSGVRKVDSASELRAVVDGWRADGRIPGGEILLQEPADGPLAMVQSVFDHGRPVAVHVNERVREGASGGASHKRSLDRPDVVEVVRRLGAGLGWHGALSADVMLGRCGPLVIDVNPRLVEPANALASGVDLVGSMLALALGDAPPTQPASRPGVRTHQALLAVLGAAQRKGTRRAVAREVLGALTHTGSYWCSVEELTPPVHDLAGTAPTVAAAVATLLSPAAHRWFVDGSTSGFALGPDAWATLRAGQPEPVAT